MFTSLIKAEKIIPLSEIKTIFEKNFDILKLEIHYILEELKREDFNCIDI